jgi:hypothetical protein
MKINLDEIENKAKRWGRLDVDLPILINSNLIECIQQLRAAIVIISGLRQTADDAGFYDALDKAPKWLAQFIEDGNE